MDNYLSEEFSKGVLIFNQIKLEFAMSRGGVSLNFYLFTSMSAYRNWSSDNLFCNRATLKTEVSSEQAPSLDGIVQQ